MKNYFLLLGFFLLISGVSAQTDHNETNNEKKSEKKIVIKKIIVNGDNKSSDEALELKIEEELKAAGVDPNSKEVRIIISDGDQVKEITKNGDQKVIVLGNEPAQGKCKIVEKNCLGLNAINCKPDKAVMGVTLENAGGNNGVLVRSVFEGSGAEKAGIQKGDIILKIENNKVKDYESVVKILESYKIDDKIKIQYLRNGEVEKTSITLGKCTPEMCKPGFWSEMENEIKDLDQKHKISEQLKIDAEELKEEAKQLQERARDLVRELHDEVNEDRSDRNSNKESLELSYLSGSPNPNQGQLKIQYQGPAGPLTISVVDLGGKELFSEKIADFTGKYEKEINLEHTKGTVILKIAQGNKILQEKIVIE